MTLADEAKAISDKYRADRVRRGAANSVPTQRQLADIAKRADAQTAAAKKREEEIKTGKRAAPSNIATGILL